MDLWSRLDDVHARCNVLEHPFYERWSAGELSREDLARYAGQYRYAVVALFAIESAQPAISRVKAEGLRDHYGFPTGPATAYFDLHAERDFEHAAEGRELISARLDGADEDAMVAEAERVLRANCALLDGVERLCAR